MNVLMLDISKCLTKQLVKKQDFRTFVFVRVSAIYILEVGRHATKFHNNPLKAGEHPFVLRSQVRVQETFFERS